jgi:hypothetical protein
MSRSNCLTWYNKTRATFGWPVYFRSLLRCLGRKGTFAILPLLTAIFCFDWSPYHGRTKSAGFADSPTACISFTHILESV